MSVPVKILPVSSLPLQLCSLQIFFFFYLFFGKNEKLKADLNCFMCMCMLVGAPFAILLPNSSTSFTNPVAYQFFLYHAMIIIYAIYQIKTHQVTYTMRNLKIDLGLLGVLTICSIWINSIFAATGHPTNFFYTMCPPADHLPEYESVLGNVSPEARAAWTGIEPDISCTFPLKKEESYFQYFSKIRF